MFSPNCCKLSDFGLSRFVGNTNVYEVLFQMNNVVICFTLFGAR